jgi:hypothetical protein
MFDEGTATRKRLVSGVTQTSLCPTKTRLGVQSVPAGVKVTPVEPLRLMMVTAQVRNLEVVLYQDVLGLEGAG